MNIQTSYDFPPIPVRDFDWSAIDADTYDGAPDSCNRYQVGRGPTQESAIQDLLAILLDDDQH